MRIKAKEIAIATGGKIVHGDMSAVVCGVSTDTRGECEDMLFVPLVGENFDGHEFIDTALAKGAAAVLTSRGDINLENVPFNAAIILVGDTLDALGKLAAWYRMKFNPLVVAITGSVGKTTTKEMIALVLSKKYNVLKTEGNKNNEIGLPLTIFGLTEEHTALILELGMNQPGEIGRLSKIARPDIAIITNIGDAHIRQFGTKQNILKAKLEILGGLSKNGTVFLNGDDMLLKGLTGLIDRPVVYYGLDEGLDVTGADARMKGDKGLEFKFAWHMRDYSVVLNAAGVHNIHNALAAVALGLQNGVAPKQITEALLDFKPDRLRMNILDLGSIRMINDTYNANPQSMLAAINVLAGINGDGLSDYGIDDGGTGDDSMDDSGGTGGGGLNGGWPPNVDCRGGGRRIAVLGDMLELGEYTQERHREVGAYLLEKGVDILVAVGANAPDLAFGAGGGLDDMGKTRRRIGAGVVESHVFAERGGVAGFVLKLLQPGDIVLVKGSRGMQMDQIAESIEKAIKYGQAL